MLARRSRSVLAPVRGALRKPTCPVHLSKFSTIAPLQQAVPTQDPPTTGPRLPLSLQAVYHAPLRRTPTHGLPVCDLQLRSYSVRNLEFMCDFALRAAYYCNLPAAGPVPLPKKTERWTVPRGHFVHKKSQENFERVTHKRLIQIKDGHPETVELWLAFIRKHQYYGVGMKANVWGFDELGVGKRMNVSLETLKDVPRPKWAHFGSRRNFETAEKVREILASEEFQGTAVQGEQVDAALKQVTGNEALQARVKEILESPMYKVLAGMKGDAVRVEEVQEKVKVMAQEEVLERPEGVAPETAEAAAEQTPVDVAPEDTVPAKAPEETTPEAKEPVPTPAEAETLSKAPTEPLEQTPEVSEAAPEPTQVETQPEDKVLANVPEEIAPEVPEATPEPEALTTTPAKPVEQVTPEVFEAAPEPAQVETQPEDEVLANLSSESAEATPEPAQAEVIPEAQIPVEEVTPEPTQVEIKPEDEVLANTPVEPAEEATPEVSEANSEQAKVEEDVQVKLEILVMEEAAKAAEEVRVKAVKESKEAQAQVAEEDPKAAEPVETVSEEKKEKE